MLAAAIGKGDGMTASLKSVGGITLFVEDPQRSKSFYARVFDAAAVYEDEDAVYAQLGARGVVLLNGPMDRDWGVRTAAFADPDGHVWEIAQQLPTGESP
jgi:catechol 2,3-dioxygenase-like lactoylglutathione lyase family enzyme